MATEKRLVYAADVRREILYAEPRLAYIVNRVKTVDAVEVVRCKDCKKKRCEHGYLWCFKWDEQVQEDDFCSYGERRIEE